MTIKKNKLNLKNFFSENSSQEENAVNSFLKGTFNKYNICVDYKELYKLNNLTKKIFGDKEKITLKFLLKSPKEIEEFKRLLNTINSRKKLNFSFSEVSKPIKLKIVISQNPEDIAKKDTGRSWKSCRTISSISDEKNLLNSLNFLSREIFITFVAYLYLDDSLQNKYSEPIASLQIVPYLNLTNKFLRHLSKIGSSIKNPEKEKEIILKTIKHNENGIYFKVAEEVYGITKNYDDLWKYEFLYIPKKFKQIVQAFLNKKQKTVLSKINENLVTVFKIHPYVFKEKEEFSKEIIFFSDEFLSKYKKFSNIYQILLLIKNKIFKKDKKTKISQTKGNGIYIKDSIYLDNFRLSNLKKLGEKEFWKGIICKNFSFRTFKLKNLIALKCKLESFSFEEENFLKDCNLVDCNFSGKAKIINCTFEKGFSFFGDSSNSIYIKNSIFKKPLRRITFSNCYLKNLEFTNFSPVSFPNPIIFENCIIDNEETNYIFKEKNINDPRFTFKNTIIKNTSFENLNIEAPEINYSKNRIENTNINSSIIKKFKLSDCNLSETFLSDCKINFKSNLKVENCSFKDCFINATSKIIIKNSRFVNSGVFNLVLKDCFWEAPSINWSTNCSWEKGYILISPEEANKLFMSLEKYNIEIVKKSPPFEKNSYYYAYTHLNPLQFEKIRNEILNSKK